MNLDFLRLFLTSDGSRHFHASAFEMREFRQTGWKEDLLLNFTLYQSERGIAFFRSEDVVSPTHLRGTLRVRAQSIKG